MNDRRLENIRNLFRSLNLKEEIANSVAGGGIAGLPPDEPPVNPKKKKKKFVYGGTGSRKMWLGK